MSYGVQTPEPAMLVLTTKAGGRTLLASDTLLLSRRVQFIALVTRYAVPATSLLARADEMIE
jgi:hypothetical protein